MSTQRRTTRMGDPLTQRQLDVLALSAEGLTRTAIGTKLGLTEGGVKNHVDLLLRKLGARNITHAVALAIRARLIP